MVEQALAWLVATLPWLLAVIFAAALMWSLVALRKASAEVARYKTELVQHKRLIAEARHVAERQADDAAHYRGQLEGARQGYRPPQSASGWNEGAIALPNAMGSSGSGTVTDAQDLPPHAPPLQSADPAFSPALVQELYAGWCRTGEKPIMPNTVFATPVTFVRAERANELAEPVFLFEDHPQIGPFVRFAPGMQADTAVALPHPDAAFNADVHHMLFPSLSAAAFENVQALSTLQPVPLRRRADNTWEKSS